MIVSAGLSLSSPCTSLPQARFSWSWVRPSRRSSWRRSRWRADRLPWLRAVARWIDDRLAAHKPGIVTCSNLKRAYRQITIGSRQGVRLVFLTDDEQVIHARIVQRQHRYMPPALLRSQFETLEEPGEDEHPLVVTVHGSIAETVTELLQRLGTDITHLPNGGQA